MPADLPILPADFTQATRLLRLTTPLGADRLLAECVRGEEALSEPYTFTISALSLDAGISLRSLLGQPALLELLTSANGRPRQFHGFLTAAESNGANGGMARYTLTLQPWTAFLARSRDSRIFQRMTVPDILDTLFATWQGRGKLAPAWRFDIADRAAYPMRSLATQYQESDLAFAERLMHEAGLFYFFEHAADAGGPGLGKHTMVIADHNGAFKAGGQRCVRFTRPGAVMKEDSMDRWRREVRLQTNAVELRSWDYRSVDNRVVASYGAGQDELVSHDVPGHYAYPNRAHGQRIADRQMEALETRKEVFIGAGTVRTLAPGTTFVLTGHAVHDRDADDDARTFAITRVRHLMHNNLSADLTSAVHKRVGESPLAQQNGKDLACSLHGVRQGKGERPLYRNRIDAIRARVPFRASRVDGHGCLLHPRPTVRGQQTAVVVGPPGAVIHTDRDHRVKIQFHWQRGVGDELGHNRLSHPFPSKQTGAPGDDSAGVWVRVVVPLGPIAGANWGGSAVPRVGQEVIVDFLDGDIDRPVIIGALYNGKGAPDAQHNEVSHGAGAATGNAPAWFPGEAGGHAHAAVLSGLKSQAMQRSQDGAGAYSQLVFDDSPGQGRLALQRHASVHKGTDELNLGHLRHQADNQRLQGVGFGAELKTEHNLAVRAGQGLLLSADKRAGAGGSQMDSREAQEQVGASVDMEVSLASTAQKHNSDAAPDEMQAIAALRETGQVLGSRGAGEVGAYSQPHLQVSSPSGIVVTTPANSVLSAGNTTNLSAGQDINFVAQASSHYAVADGIRFFTYGKASNSGKPNQETGLKLHAATGKFSSKSDSGETRITADKAITVASVTKQVSIGAKNHVLLSAQGACLRLEGGNITIMAPGKVEFKASLKELGGPVSVPTLQIAHKVQELSLKRDIEIEYRDADGNALTDEAIDLYFNGRGSKTVELGATGKATVKNAPLGPLRAEQPRRKKGAS